MIFLSLVLSTQEGGAADVEAGAAGVEEGGAGVHGTLPHMATACAAERL